MANDTDAAKTINQWWVDYINNDLPLTMLMDTGGLQRLFLEADPEDAAKVSDYINTPLTAMRAMDVAMKGSTTVPLHMPPPRIESLDYRDTARARWFSRTKNQVSGSHRWWGQVLEVDPQGFLEACVEDGVLESSVGGIWFKPAPAPKHVHEWATTRTWADGSRHEGHLLQAVWNCMDPTCTEERHTTSAVKLEKPSA